MAAVLTAAGLVATVLGPDSPAAAHPVNAADFQQVDPRQGRRRGGRADGHGGAAGPLGAAHRPQRHAAPHRRRRRHHRDRHPRRSTPTTRRACRASASTPASPPTGTSTSTTPRRCPPRAVTRPATGTDFSAWNGRQPAVPLHAQRRLHPEHRQPGRPSWTWPTNRGMCCHVGGDIDFDAAGNLYLSTGDDTNPFDSAGYSPLDERTDRNPGVRRPAQRRQHQRPARQGAADQGERQRDVLDPGRATCSRPAPRRPARRSTRWASATRSG